MCETKMSGYHLVQIQAPNWSVAAKLAGREVSVMPFVWVKLVEKLDKIHFVEATCFAVFVIELECFLTPRKLDQNE